MDNELFSRSIGLLGEGNFNRIQDVTIAVFGLGGVGGTALEALARTGFKHFIIVDFDKVDASNINRQILYTANDVGKNKTDVAKERILAINPDADIKAFSLKAQDFDFNQHIDFKSKRLMPVAFLVAPTKSMRKPMPSTPPTRKYSVS